ncbi:helix-turn-helix transcriptional regulator [Nocardioides cavernae]|uniref:Helix-turn-helix transcriptional regulator n=1 Tax=Nocardioides cavernae TaxID=1921566 RepID=A0ABR8N6R1_9ACTN|nr:TetR/AcrR family transcriptional regulator [Nocardioides cavernae]MBD3923831.1 helix-turn-helix transcriptional regulator [Nocardioides cavernae]MBM7511235.1 AcrR family transcriptional regulator [Nocardioides cavernae]
MTSLRHTTRATADPRLDGYLDAARACILDVGWRRTTLTEVAKRAGVSRMTIYRAWPDMGSLLGDLMTREWVGIAAATQVAAADTTTPEGIAEAALATVRALRDNELFVRIVELDPDLMLPYLLHRRGRSQEALVEILAAEIASGQADGAIRAGDPVLMARSLTLAAHGFVFSALTMTDDRIGLDDLDAEYARGVARALEP